MRARPKSHRFTRPHLQGIVLVVMMSTLALALWAQVAAPTLPWQERPLRIWLLDVGQGDAILIEAPTGERLLIDGGPDRSVLSKLGSILPPWDRRVDYLIATHPDADHITALVELKDRHLVRTFIETGAQARTPVGEAWASLDVPRRQMLAGDTMQIGQLTLMALWPDVVETYPENRNDASLVLRLDYGDTSVLLTGDAEEGAEEKFAARAGDIDVLKVGHHGSLSSTTWTLINGTEPEVALISAGTDNSYGHPHPVIVSRLESAGATVYRTDMQGDILLTSYGAEPAVEAHSLPF